MTTNNENKYRPRMQPNQPGKLNTKRTFLIGLGFATAMAAWSFYNFKVPLLLTEMIPADISWFFGLLGQNTLIGLIMTLDNIVAISIQPYFGALSDRMMSKYGRRMPFVIIGCLTGAFFLALAPWITVLIGFVTILVAFNFAMAFYRAPVVTLMPDYTPEKVRSTGNAVINLMGGVGTVFGFVVQPIVSALKLGTIYNRNLGFIFISIFMLIALALLLISVKETPTGDGFFKIGDHSIKIDSISLQIQESSKEEIAQDAKRSRWEDLILVFKEKEKSGLFMLLAIFTWFFGYNAIETFFSKFATEYLNISESSASTLMLILPVTLIVAAFPAGLLGIKLGRRKTMTIGLIGLGFVLILLIFVAVPERSVVLFAVGFALIGILWAFININSIAVVWALAPEGKTGAYTGVYYTFSQMAAILSPIMVGAILDIAGKNMGVNKYQLIFPFVFVCIGFALFFLSRVKRGEANLTPEEVEKLKKKYEQDD